MKKLLFLLGIVMSAFSFLQAQVNIKLSVMDQSGQGIENALVSFESKAKTIKKSGFTNSEGELIIVLSKDVYQVSIDGGLNYVKLMQERQIDEGRMEFILKSKSQLLPEVFVETNRVAAISPISLSELKQDEIERLNDGREIPMILQELPSLVAYSDAGNGIGYSYLRIRGSDQTRINVTINGVPLNDSESHQVFWVDLPDFGSSLASIQVQRGVGSSSFGPGAFGANIALDTKDPTENYALAAINIGSFNTQRIKVEAAYNGFSLRLSKLKSDGYIDRSNADLFSYQLQYAKQWKQTKIKLLHLNGEERTRQSWNGVPEALINSDNEALENHIARNGYNTEEKENLRNSDRRYNFYTYENEVDQYRQVHNQIHISQNLKNQAMSFAASLFQTDGKGYFEQYKTDEDASDYGMPDRIIGEDTISSGDIVRRRWLDNHFYGLNLSGSYLSDNFSLKLATNLSQYSGDHYGRLINGDFVDPANLNNYYESVSLKNDLSSYVQFSYSWRRWLVSTDIQFRTVDYKTRGSNNDLRRFDVDESYQFLNPKIGLTHNWVSWSAYGHFAIANREPVRDDFTDGQTENFPKSERLNNLELGLRKSLPKGNIGLNAFLMQYKDQLIPTGEVNDVGALVRRNIDESQRYGLELDLKQELSDQFKVSASLTWMRTNIAAWDELIYEYGEGENVTNVFKDTEMAFSPEWISFARLSYTPFAFLQLDLENQFVSDQFLDNTASTNKQIKAYSVQNLRLSLNKRLLSANCRLSFAVYNALDTKYSGSGYTYSYNYNQETVTENFFYPQAGRNYNLGLEIKI